MFLSMIPLAYFVFKMVKDKNLFLATVVVLIVLVQPILITPSIMYDDLNFLHYRMISLDVQTYLASLPVWLHLSERACAPNHALSRRHLLWFL